MSITGLVTAIAKALPTIKRGSLVVFGDTFGGRIDNIHSVVGAAANDDGSATIQFDHGESLTVWDPAGIDVSAARFRILRASRVRWEWFYYGRDPTPENRFYIEHQAHGSKVVTEDNAPGANIKHAPSLSRPAVELLDGWETN